MIIKGIKRTVFLLICLFFFYTAGCVIHAKEISLSRKFSVGEIEKINIQTLFEDVKVIAGPDDMIYLDYYGKAATSRNAEEILRISLEENLLSLESNWSGDDRNWSSSLGTSNVVNLDLRVPAKLLESLDIESTSGVVRLSDISTDNTKLKTTSGDVHASGLNLDSSLDIESTSGVVRLSDISTDNTKLKTTSGDVRASGLNLDSSLDIESTSGDMRLNDISTNNTRLKTTSGDINIMSIQNSDTSFMHTTSGNIDVAFKDPGLKITGRANSGNISLRLPVDQGFTLTANTISGRIRNYFSSSRNATRVDESVGSGSPLNINLDTTSGDIKIYH